MYFARVSSRIFQGKAESLATVIEPVRRGFGKAPCQVQQVSHASQTLHRTDVMHVADSETNSVFREHSTYETDTWLSDFEKYMLCDEASFRANLSIHTPT